MAATILLNIQDKTIKGECRSDDYEDWIEVLSWSWCMNQSGTTHMGVGSGSGKVAVEDITLTKYVDTGTAQLIAQCCTGQILAKAELHVVDAAGSGPVPYFKILMNDIVVTSYSTGHDGGSDRLVESLSLNFRKFEVTYDRPVNGSGQARVPSGMGFDIAKNVRLK